MRGITKASATAPEWLVMPSKNHRFSSVSLRIRSSRALASRRRVVARAGLLAALLAIGMEGRAEAAPELHAIFFRPSPSPTVAGYVLHLGTESGQYTQEVDLGLPNEFESMLAYVTNIETSVDVYAALSSYDQYGIESSTSNEVHLAAATTVSAPGAEPTPAPSPEPTPEPIPEPIPEPTVDPGHGTTLAAVHAMTSLGVTSDATGRISMVRGDGSTFALTIDSLAAAQDLRPTRCDLDGDGDSDLIVGFGPGSNGQVALIRLENGSVSSVESLVAGDAAYHANDGQSHPACGDIDGDGRNELVIGMGPYAGAQLAVFDSSDTGFAPFAGSTRGMFRAPVPESIGPSGTACIPALGDIDGDGRDELVVGFPADGHRSIAILDDGLSDFQAYVGLEDRTGLVRVAHREDDADPRGGTYPALGDWDGDGLAEFAIGYGDGGGSWMLFLDDGLNTRLDRYSGYLYVAVGREDIQSAEVAIRPAFGDIDADGRDEIVVSFGRQGSRELQVFEDMFTGSTNVIRNGAGFVDAGDESIRWMAAPER